jgi:hypothetical protein
VEALSAYLNPFEQVRQLRSALNQPATIADNKHTEARDQNVRADR